MRRDTQFAFLLFATIFSISATAQSHVPAVEPKLLSPTSQDITNTWGPIQFSVTPLQFVTECANPGFELSCCPTTATACWA